MCDVTLAARVAEAWHAERRRWRILEGDTETRWAVVGGDAEVHAVFNTPAKCRAWVDEQCGRAAARVVLEAMGEPSEELLMVMMMGAPDEGPIKKQVVSNWTAALAAFRREMGIC